MISDISHQHLAVFSHPKDDKSANKLVLEGNVVQKGECRPIGDSNYMKLKAKQMKEARKPQRVIQMLDVTPIAFKPISNHKTEVYCKSKSFSEAMFHRFAFLVVSFKDGKRS